MVVELWNIRVCGMMPNVVTVNLSWIFARTISRDITWQCVGCLIWLHGIILVEENSSTLHLIFFFYYYDHKHEFSFQGLLTFCFIKISSFVCSLWPSFLSVAYHWHGHMSLELAHSDLNIDHTLANSFPTNVIIDKNFILWDYIRFTIIEDGSHDIYAKPPPHPSCRSSNCMVPWLVTHTKAAV